MSKNDDINQLAEEFLDIWQENIRLWAVEKELLPLPELLELVKGGKERGDKDD